MKYLLLLTLITGTAFAQNNFVYGTGDEGMSTIGDFYKGPYKCRMKVYEKDGKVHILSQLKKGILKKWKTHIDTSVSIEKFIDAYSGAVISYKEGLGKYPCNNDSSFYPHCTSIYTRVSVNPEYNININVKHEPVTGNLLSVSLGKGGFDWGKQYCDIND
jgi:hypothetical protein